MSIFLFFFVFFFFKQKTAYEMLLCDWSSDVCSSDLRGACPERADHHPGVAGGAPERGLGHRRLAPLGPRGQGAVKILLSNWSCGETSARASWVKGESRRCPSRASLCLRRTLSTDVGSARRAERRGWRSPPGRLA